MSESTKLKIGLDPEFFLYKDGKPISAHDIVPGTKAKPYKLPNCHIQADGTAVEFNTIPASTADEFVEHLRAALNDIRKIIPKEYDFKYIPSVQYPKDYFAALPRSARDIGCEPDFSAHNLGQINSRPKSPDWLAAVLRTGAAHIHVGWGEGLDIKSQGHKWDCIVLVNNLYNAFNSFIPIWDKDVQRRNMYGGRGSYRPKTYGVEYRELSNAWLRYPELWPWVFNTVKATFDKTIEGKMLVSPRRDYYYPWETFTTPPSKEIYEQQTRYSYGYPSGYIPIQGVWRKRGEVTDLEQLVFMNNSLRETGMPEFPTNFTYKEA